VLSEELLKLGLYSNGEDTSGEFLTENTFRPFEDSTTSEE